MSLECSNRGKSMKSFCWHLGVIWKYLILFTSFNSSGTFEMLLGEFLCFKFTNTPILYFKFTHHRTIISWSGWLDCHHKKVIRLQWSDTPISWGMQWLTNIPFHCLLLKLEMGPRLRLRGDRTQISRWDPPGHSALFSPRDNQERSCPYLIQIWMHYKVFWWP